MSAVRERRPRCDGEGNYELRAGLTLAGIARCVEAYFKLGLIPKVLYDAFYRDPVNKHVVCCMTQVIIIQGGDLESYYEQTLHYLHQKYHQYPSNLLDLHVDPNVMAEAGMYERLARDIAAEAPIDPSLPPGKIVL